MVKCFNVYNNVCFVIVVRFGLMLMVLIVYSWISCELRYINCIIDVKVSVYMF